MLILSILTSETQVKRKAEWGSFVYVQSFVGLWLLIRAAGFFAFAPRSDCIHSCTVASARIRLPRL